MRKLLIILMLMMASETVFSQSRYKTHTVKQGETIESVAGKYGISESELILANPQADGNYCYVGMKLNIPSGKYNSGVSKTSPIKEIGLDSRQWRGSFATETEFQYALISGISKALLNSYNTDYFSCGMSTDFGYRFYLHHNFFIEGFAGYRWYSLWIYENPTTSITVHNITMPIHLGANIDITEKFGIRPFFGPRVDIPVSSIVKQGYYSASAGINTGVTLEFGIDFQFNKWGIRTKYGLGVGKYKDANYISLGITTGI